MRIDLCLDARRPGSQLLDLAARAEGAGWDGVRLGDPGTGPPAGRECWAVMGALAAAVPRLRLGAVVGGDVGRHPAVVAKLASTVEQLSAGRLLLGWAPGSGPDGEARLAEAVEVVRGLAGGGPASYQGRFYRMTDAPLDPPMVQQPFPVLVVGGTAALAARCADHWSVGGSRQEIRAQLASLAAACRRTGRPLDEITVSAWTDGEAPPAGVAEWVIPDAALGADARRWEQALARIRAETAARD